ncbi:hypothetical protein JYU34_002461 [Plutella xylostella]|uniref:C2H2-type domain-containing protein n=1 Tax=Plutella xylostella TaxID=51655 RepID=A0ABQ7R293_PLUXY|nr:hypothetical protein JYU34_002461 [Plutella xylostella]
MSSYTSHNLRHSFYPRKPLNHDFGQDIPREHWCETCDRDFRSAQQLQTHIQQHETCNIDGCKFVAHPKVITKHIQMQHSSGLYNKIAKLDNPEAIQKWREERKKKYPTKVNVEKKTAEIKEKIDRGEKMCLERKKKFQTNNKSGFKREKDTPNKNNLKVSNINNNKKRHRPAKISAEVIPEEKKMKMQPFCGIQDLLTNSDSEEMTEETSNNFLIDDEDFVEDSATPIPSEKSEKTAVCSAISNLICNYGSSDEDDTEVTPVDPPKKVNEILPKSDIVTESKEISTSKNISDDDSGPDEVKTNNIKENVESEMPAVEALKNTTKKFDKTSARKVSSFNHGRHVKTSNHKYKPKIPSTLLQKLLSKEIRQERNIVLQCIRHIVTNNYFEDKK